MSESTLAVPSFKGREERGERREEPPLSHPLSPL